MLPCIYDHGGQSELPQRGHHGTSCEIAHRDQGRAYLRRRNGADQRTLPPCPAARHRRKKKQWEDIANFMVAHKNKWYGQHGERVDGISGSGLSYAGVGGRINPEVAVVVRSPSISLDELHQKCGDMEALMHELLAFVPYSCIFPQSRDHTHTLILPMGLQKTPGGYGFKNPPDPRDVPTVVKNGYRRYAKQPGEITGVLPRLLSAIKARHPKMAVLTRFAAQFRVPTWESMGIRQWESQFPGHLRVGWLSYHHLHEIEKDTEDYKKLENEIEALHRQRRGKQPDEKRSVYCCVHAEGAIPLTASSHTQVY